jgi:hypothetical protein
LSVSGRREEIERRLGQCRRLSTETNDQDRLDKLIGDLEAEQQQQEQDDKK